jgi:hypothetical protein
MCVPLSLLANERLCKNVTAATNTRKNRTIGGRVVFFAVSVVSKENVQFFPELLVSMLRL